MNNAAQKIEEIFRQKDGRGKITEEERLLFKRYDPIERKKFDASILLLNGDSDETISLKGNQDYYVHLSEHEYRNNVELRIYPSINHQFTDNMFSDLLTWLQNIY